MKNDSIPYSCDAYKNDFLFLELFNRVTEKRASWKDIYDGPGIYVIYLIGGQQPMFYTNKTNPNLGNQATCASLKKKWRDINKKNDTDIVYIGKGESLKERIRDLIRFGHGKTNKHFGGEWLWQILNLDVLRLLISSCPIGQEFGYEKYLLNKFKRDHNNWPLCNRNGGQNVLEWHPECNQG